MIQRLWQISLVVVLLADTDELIGGSFTYDDFDTARAGQYQDVFQTSIDPAIEELNRQRDLRQSQNAADAIRAGAFGGSRLGLREATTDAEIARAGSDLRREAGRDALEFASQRYDTDRTFDASRFDADRGQRFALKMQEEQALKQMKLVS